ncbi:peptidylprolyl isomerase [Altererythrobacter sp. GH1-8]|uniref:peptidylprolyl isomerase n=1 Tax=Altererythrobacter sp. GH1-8 TaxID=3349333 RepID=UPI00374D5FDB
MDSFRFICTFGCFEIALDQAAAPQTCAYFMRKFAEPQFVDASIFRILTGDNSSVSASVPIEVIQFGLDHDGSVPLDRIDHEGTDRSGLRHERWTVSAARYGKGEVYPSCFICMRDEPELDHGGARQPDGEGFAAFAKVTSGFETLRRIFELAESRDYLSEAIPLTVVRNLNENQAC